MQGTEDQMELWQIRYFLAVAEELNFSRAARRLNVSQPPVSRAIRSLEAELEAPLFRRTRHRVELTEAGRLFREEAARIVAQVERSVRLARRGEAPARRLAIGFEAASVADVICRSVQEYRRQVDGLEVTLHEMPSSRQLAALADGTIDAGFVVLPVEAGPFLVQPVVEEPLVVAMPREHRFAHLTRVPVASLADEPFVSSSCRDRCGLYRQVLALCRVAGFFPRIVLDVNETHVMLRFVAAGSGIAIVPQSAVRLVGEELAAVPLAPEAVFRLALARPDGTPSPTLAGYLDVVARIVAGGGAGADHRRGERRTATG
jgi:DNA-binding transcriptional LysR family regulator